MVIGIAGKAQCGKDTTSDLICYIFDKYRDKEAWDIEEFTEEYIPEEDFLRLKPSCIKRAFAGVLKQCTAKILGMWEGSLEDIDVKNRKIDWLQGQPTIRQFLQKFGTEVGRVIDPDIWIKTTFRDYECIRNLHPEKDKNFYNLVISDVRFPNEIEAIRNKEGIVIKVTRNGVESAGNHSSETILDDYTDWDYVIENNKSLYDLALEIEAILLKEKLIQK